MIRSCRDKETEKVLNRVPSRRLQAIQDIAEERLAQLNAAVSLRDLSLPGLRLERLTGDRKGQYSIRINRQYRVAAPEILAGQRFDVSLDAFLDVYGNHFYYQRQQIRDVHLTAKVPGGTPVDTHMDFHREGLAGLADVGVFKKKEKR